MFSEVSDMYVDIAQATEYQAAVAQHGDRFADDNEAEEVLQEEMYEASVEAENFSRFYEYPLMDIDIIEHHVRLCIKECAQVLAVIKKIQKTKA